MVRDGQHYHAIYLETKFDHEGNYDDYSDRLCDRSEPTTTGTLIKGILGLDCILQVTVKGPGDTEVSIVIRNEDAMECRGVFSRVVTAMFNLGFVLLIQLSSHVSEGAGLLPLDKRSLEHIYLSSVLSAVVDYMKISAKSQKRLKLENSRLFNQERETHAAERASNEAFYKDEDRKKAAYVQTYTEFLLPSCGGQKKAAAVPRVTTSTTNCIPWSGNDQEIQ